MRISEIKDVPLRHLAQSRVNPEWAKNNRDLDVLVNAFDWEKTPEGSPFWNDVDDGRVTKLEIKPSVSEKKPMRGTRTHYENSTGKYDVIDIINDYKLNFNRGNIVKYVLRCGKKDNSIQELEKAKDYIERELEILRREQDQWIIDNKD